MPSRPQPPERRRLEANRGLRSRAARADRPKLAEALAACRLHRAKLIIAKLDRLARNDFRRGWPEFLAHGRHFDSTLPRKQQFVGLSREPGTRAKLIPQDWMTDIPEKTPLVLLMRGVLPSPDAVGNSGSRSRS